MKRLVPLLLLAACSSTPSGSGDRKQEFSRPDEAALARETLVQARSATVVLSADWRREAKLSALRVDRPADNVEVARGQAVFVLRGLRIEAGVFVKVTWLPDHENLLVSAREVSLFQQKRAQPYYSKDLSMVTMANDQVSFFQQ